jgi:peptide/nickel transport system permease protein
VRGAKQRWLAPLAKGASHLLGIGLVGLLLLLAIAGPSVAPNDPGRQFPDYVYAPPMRPHVIDDAGRWHLPFYYPLRLVDRLERRYEEDRRRPTPLGSSSINEPWFPLGTDALGRDQFARLALGTRYSLGVSLLAALVAVCLGAAVGGVAGLAGGLLDEGLMRLSDFLIALPVLYVVLALRAAMPLVLTTSQVFWTIVLVLVAVGWPFPARGVRAVVASERTREYAEAARAIGSSRTRLLLRHLLPAARGFLIVQATLLVPAFILAEATLSFVGLGFGEPVPSWGAMLRDAGRGRALVEAPWLLASAGAIVLAALAINLWGQILIFADRGYESAGHAKIKI